VPLTPQQMADFQRLRQSYAPVVEAQRRKQQAQANLEKMHGLPPVKPQPKAGGGSADANLAQFLEGSHTPMRLYHGTTATEGGKRQEAIRRLKPSKEGAFGPGVYMTPDTEYASGYTGVPAMSQIQRDVTSDSDYARAGATKMLNRMNKGEVESHEVGGNMLPLHARILNPLVVDMVGPGDPNVMALMTMGVTKDKAYDIVEKAYEKQGGPGKHVYTRAKALGHDAMIIKRNGKIQEVIHYNPKMIKSAIGNRGTYDTTKDDLNMAKGGSVEPKKTVKAYKLFRVHPDHPGKLFPLFVDANTPVEMNKWTDAKEGEMANGKVKSKIGALAYRPGWHAGDLPIATHIGEKSDPKLTAPDRRPANHAWAEVEMPDDVDWQSEATKRGTNAQGKVIPVKSHITDQIPKGGHYRYKTNPNMTGNWLIGGSMKVNKVLTDAEVKSINKAAGMSDLPRAQPFKKKTFGFAGGGCVGPQQWMAEEHVNHKAKGGEVENDYRGEHTAPGPHYGAPLHDVSSNGMYPADFYGPMGRRYYANEGWDFDQDAYSKVTRVKGKPNEMVSIHRAVPTSVYKEALKKDSPLKHMIRKGDWVAINKDYAKQHGESVLLGDYKIASMRVPAKHVWTNADSIHEWGYHPEEKARGGRVTHAHHLDIEERPL
jgi:hypothetical protein